MNLLNNNINRHIIIIYNTIAVCLIYRIPCVYFIFFYINPCSNHYFSKFDNPQGDEWITTALAMVGKMGVSAAYAIIYLISAELIPTVIRNSAMGFCSVFENLGAVVAPYIADLVSAFRLLLHFTWHSLIIVFVKPWKNIEWKVWLEK